MSFPVLFTRCQGGWSLRLKVDANGLLYPLETTGAGWRWKAGNTPIDWGHQNAVIEPINVPSQRTLYRIACSINQPANQQPVRYELTRYSTESQPPENFVQLTGDSSIGWIHDNAAWQKLGTSFGARDWVDIDLNGQQTLPGGSIRTETTKIYVLNGFSWLGSGGYGLKPGLEILFTIEARGPGQFFRSAFTSEGEVMPAYFSGNPR